MLAPSMKPHGTYKIAYRRVSTGNGWQSTSVSYAKDLEELHRLLEGLPDPGACIAIATKLADRVVTEYAYKFLHDRFHLAPFVRNRQDTHDLWEVGICSSSNQETTWKLAIFMSIAPQPRTRPRAETKRNIFQMSGFV